MNKYHFLLATVIVFTITACTPGKDQESELATLPANLAPATETAPAEVAAAPEMAEPESLEPAATATMEETPVSAVLPVLGAAPAWNNEVWINTDEPLPLEDLRGKVVLLEFWTFG